MDSSHIFNMTQYIADNVDHDIRTTDGMGTFHGMGIISATECPTEAVTAAESTLVPRSQKRLLASDIASQKGVRIEPHLKHPKSGLAACLS